MEKLPNLIWLASQYDIIILFWTRKVLRRKSCWRLIDDPLELAMGTFIHVSKWWHCDATDIKSIVSAKLPRTDQGLLHLYSHTLAWSTWKVLLPRLEVDNNGGVWIWFFDHELGRSESERTISNWLEAAWRLPTTLLSACLNGWIIRPTGFFESDNHLSPCVGSH